MNLNLTKKVFFTSAISNKLQVANDKLINYSQFLHDIAKTMCHLNCELSDSFADNRLETNEHCSKKIILNENSSCTANNHHLATNHLTSTENLVENQTISQI